MGAGSRDSPEQETLVSFSENCRFNRACVIATKFCKDHKLAPHVICMLIDAYITMFNEFRDARYQKNMT